MPEARAISRPLLVLILSSILLAPLLFLFSHNSNYGYDDLEYLLIGRALHQGVGFYTYGPTKSPALYYLIAGLMNLGVEFRHVSLSLAITALNLATAWCCFFIFRKWSGGWIALAVAGLSLLAGQFMEMNYLEPEPFVVITGLLAWHFLNNFLAAERKRDLLLAGLFIGLGILFKTVAGFYGLAAALAVIWRMKSRPALDIAAALGLLTAASVFPVALTAAAFGMSGRLWPFFEFTFVFPLLRISATIEYLPKLYTKLLWVNLLILAALGLLFSHRARAITLSRPPIYLALLFGLSAAIALLKNQASHYEFPALPFFLFFAASLATQLFSVKQASRHAIFVSVAVVGALALSLGIYRPTAIARLFSLRNFEPVERRQEDIVARLSPPGSYILMTTPTRTIWTYWITGRYPPPPFMAMDVKTIWTMRHQPDDFFHVLENGKLALVEFRLSQLDRPKLEDPFGEAPGDKELMVRFHDILVRDFNLALELPNRQTYWVRKPAPALP